MAQSGEIVGTVLDVGCGTGENALYLSSLGHEVTAIDTAQEAIDKARRKSLARRIRVKRVEFVNDLGAVLVPGGRYFMLCFSEREIRDGPRWVTQAEIRDTFRDGWTINDIQETKFETLIHEGGAWAWLATISRNASR